MNVEAPCRALRGALEDARQSRLDFADVWTIATTGALGRVADDAQERAQWSAVLAQTSGAWLDADAAAPAPRA